MELGVRQAFDAEADTTAVRQLQLNGEQRMRSPLRRLDREHRVARAAS